MNQVRAVIKSLEARMRLVVENLSKEYRGGAQRVRALSNVQFSLGPGVLGLLGPVAVASCG